MYACMHACMHSRLLCAPECDPLLGLVSMTGCTFMSMKHLGLKNTFCYFMLAHQTASILSSTVCTKPPCTRMTTMTAVDRYSNQ